MKLLILIATIVTAVAGPDWAQTASNPMKSSPPARPLDDYIHQLFDSASKQFVEMGDPSPIGWSHHGTFRTAVATKARPMAWPGLCEATVAQFGSMGNGTSRTELLATYKMFKVVDSLAPLPGRNKQYEGELAAKCFSAGPVLATNGAYRPEMFFIDMTPREIGVWLAARALEFTLQQARTGAVHAVCAKAKNDACRDAVTGDGELRLQQLIEVKAETCKNGVPDCVHVTGEFLISADTYGGRTWLLSSDAKVKVTNRYDRDIEGVTNVQLEGGGWIF